MDKTQSIERESVDDKTIREQLSLQNERLLLLEEELRDYESGDPTRMEVVRRRAAIPAIEELMEQLTKRLIPGP